MSNPLVAAPVSTSTPFQGAFLLEDGEALVHAIENGDWVEGGLAAFSAVADTVATVMDPLGSLIAAGLGWVMEHIEPLKGWLNDLTGDAGEVAAFAQTWANISAQLIGTGDELARIISDLDGEEGEAVAAYRRFQEDSAAHIRAAGDWAGGMSTGMEVASTIVQIVHDLVRDAIAQVVGSVISYAATLVLTLGAATPYVISQATSRTASLATRVGTTVEKLVRAIGKLGELLEKLRGLFRRFGEVADGVLPGARSVDAPHAPDAPRTPGAPADPLGPPRSGGDGDYYSVAYEMELDPADWDRSRSVHFNRANAALDDAMAADPRFAADLEAMSPGIADRVAQAGGRRNPNPEDFIWHHTHPDTVGGRPGVMHLVPTYQHTPGSSFWGTLHPGGRGGFSIWGEGNRPR